MFLPSLGVQFKATGSSQDKMMKHLLPCLAAIAWLPCISMADEIHLNPMETPDQVRAYLIEDMGNLGEVSGPQERVERIDQAPVSLHVGDLVDRARKNFLLFHLPSPPAGKKVTCATLRLFLTGIEHEAADKPLPPAWLFHAGEWPDESWLADTDWHGLLPVHFADNEVFSQKIALCGPDDRPGFIDLDVTGMIQSDYQRHDKPVAAFRLEISDREALDCSDESTNQYKFFGPGQLNAPDGANSLVLSFD